MNWQTLSFHFRQTYDGGYRYLDRCGEFMLDAVSKLDFVPGEAKPIGAKLEIPEKGVYASCDIESLNVSLEVPEGGPEYFVELCTSLAELVETHFKPTGIVRNGFAWKSFWAFSKSEEMLAASLKFNSDYCKEVGKVVGMLRNQQRLDYRFVSGSKDLHVVFEPTTFERVNVTKQSAGFRATKSAKSLIDRRNEFAERVSGFMTHALVLEVDLMEDEPPKDAKLDKHFEELQKMSNQLREFFNLK
jgi:hypothetical protein